jgi:hypothetical protein
MITIASNDWVLRRNQLRENRHNRPITSNDWVLRRNHLRENRQNVFHKSHGPIPVVPFPRRRMYTHIVVYTFMF